MASVLCWPVFCCYDKIPEKTTSGSGVVILATQEAEIRRIVVQSQPRANSSRDPIRKKPFIKTGLVG
jgi:hypothetical protein